jgi:hypothetical protein
MRLAAAGVDRVFGGGFDTFADARFYSYRRDRETGRFASVLWIAPATVKVDDLEGAEALENAIASMPEPAFARI